jgi:galactonate dehydratase
MKITALETIRLAEFSNVLWVQVHTDAGISGLGETFFGARAVEAFIHESAAPRLIGSDPLAIEKLHRELIPYAGYSGTGAETRGRSAVDIALWDILGQHTKVPVYQLLGGLTRDRIRTYNTCAGYRYVRSNPDWSTDDWGHQDSAEGPYEDLDAFLNRADELADSLLSQGITGMKIWPFDAFATQSAGQHLALPDLRTGVSIVEQIRKTVGDRIDIMMEYHGLWRLPQICQIARALDDFDVYWHEDPVPMHRFADLERFKAATTARVCGSENLGTKAWYAEAFERGCIDVAHFDLCWIGGLTEGRKIAALAETYERPIAPHDCVGPITLIASSHLTLSAPNALIQETVRAFYRGYYRDLVTELPRIEDGYLYPLQGPGLGSALLADRFARDDVKVVRQEIT